LSAIEGFRGEGGGTHANDDAALEGDYVAGVGLSSGRGGLRGMAAEDVAAHHAKSGSGENVERSGNLDSKLHGKNPHG
jgi:hypothetical protein